MGKNIIITESQYTRIFLNEQYTSADGTFYGANDVDAYKKNITNNQNQNKSFLSKPPYSSIDISKPLDYYTQTPYQKAQFQWVINGAPNPKTGHNLIPNTVLNNLKPSISRNSDVEVWSPNMDQDETGALGHIYRQRRELSQRYKSEDEMARKQAWSEYDKAAAWNATIKAQKTLIPQYCTKRVKDPRWKVEYFGNDDDSWDYAVRNHKYVITLPNVDPKTSKVSYGTPPGGRERGVIHKYLITDVSKNPFDFCNNEREQGVFVYDTKQGYRCGCINVTSNSYGYLTPYGNYSKEDILGWTKLSKEYVKENAPGFLEGVADWIGGCTEDYHCVLDLLSIAALAIPGYGVLVSFGLDAINAAAYGIEAYTTDNPEERNAAILAGTLTLGGGFLGGGYKTMKNISKASANPKIYKYMGDVVGETEKRLGKIETLKSVKDKKVLEDIYGTVAKKHGLTDNEILIAHDLLKSFRKIDPKLIKRYSNALNKVDDAVRKKTSFNLLQVFEESSWKKALQKENGDVLITLKKYMNKPLYKEFLVQIGAFLAVEEALKIPEVQEWIGQTYRDGKYVLNPSIKNRVEKDGYDWKTAKQIFGSSSSKEDNLKLEKAWKEGWRPFDKKFLSGDKEPTINDFNKVPEKYQTDTYKKRFNNVMKDVDDVVYVTDEKEVDEKNKNKRVKIINKNLVGGGETLSKQNDTNEKDVDDFQNLLNSL